MTTIIKIALIRKVSHFTLCFLISSTRFLPKRRVVTASIQIFLSLNHFTCKIVRLRILVMQNFFVLKIIANFAPK